MGYKLPPRNARLILDDFDGAEVVIKHYLPLADVLRLEAEMQAAGQSNEAAMRFFGEHILLEWNLEDAEGEPIPRGPDCLLQLPAPLSNAILKGWRDSIWQPSRPLAAESDDGLQLAEASTPTATASTSPPN